MSLEIVVHKLLLRKHEPELEVHRAPLRVVQLLKESLRALLLQVLEVLSHLFVLDAHLRLVEHWTHEPLVVRAGGNRIGSKLEECLRGGLLLRTVTN